jgi:SAM-dependent methyltransferase
LSILIIKFAYIITVLDIISILKTLKKHPSVIPYILLHTNTNMDKIRNKINELNKRQIEYQWKKEIENFTSNLKKNPISHEDINSGSPECIKLNKLCCIEDWQNDKLKKTISNLHHASEYQYINRVNWEMTNNVVSRRQDGLIHRKDWEWALGIKAMERFDKLNGNSVAIGIGTGREEILFHLTNKIKHVFATDLYDGKSWRNFAPMDFGTETKKYAPIRYRENALTVIKMNGTKLEFKDDYFDIAFSFSSIEHFGGENHIGGLKCMKEIERILKPGGVAVITTEYIINNKEHHEFFNERTIFSDLIDKLEKLKLVENLDLRLTTNTLCNVIDYDSAVYWDTSANDYDFKIKHPLVLIRVNDILVTSVMLVFQKPPLQ